MMRRVVSVLLFILGGWVLMSEMLVAFLDVAQGSGDNATMIIIFAMIAALFLVLGAWASPGHRWCELGLTVLIAAGLAVFCTASLAAVLFDPAMKRYMPNLPSLELAPVAGTLNLIAIAALGWWLYRRNSPDPADVAG